MSSIPLKPKQNPTSTPAPATPAVAPTSEPDPAPATKPKRNGGYGVLISVLLLLLVGGGALYVFGVAPRIAQKADLDREQKISDQRNVIYALARLAAPKVELPLPGTVDAFQQASIYARTSGYVKTWNSDIGDIVHENAVLAEIDTPEVDQQLSQAKATSQQAQAAVQIAQIAADRWNNMVAAHAVAQEEADEKNATLAEAKATLAADDATVGQLTATENFKHIRAPFTGKITYRNIEVGNLVTSNTNNSNTSTANSELYRIAQTDPLRVYVDVPEANSRSIQPGVAADLHVAAYPDRIFHGEVVRSAGALDEASRTLKTEIRVSNPDGALLPGTYAEVTLDLSDTTPAILIPANTLIVNSIGTQVALVINRDGRDLIHFLPVKVGRDFGTEVEILEDVKEGDRLVTNPPADLTEGAEVSAKPIDMPAASTPSVVPKS
jgi:RND family efflux transporter MFP subunit